MPLSVCVSYKNCTNTIHEVASCQSPCLSYHFSESQKKKNSFLRQTNKKNQINLSQKMSVYDNNKQIAFYFIPTTTTKFIWCLSLKNFLFYISNTQSSAQLSVIYVSSSSSYKTINFSLSISFFSILKFSSCSSFKKAIYLFSCLLTDIVVVIWLYTIQNIILKWNETVGIRMKGKNYTKMQNIYLLFAIYGAWIEKKNHRNGTGGEEIVYE